ncbi:hypothetical protein [Helicobacter sp. 10-6591]|uniref:hypothetical protein n=1 Tax=Helicobacter sp. 10-6591 TaxID=2004998 RepID=UPI0011BD90F5|nr:hypothetical protein [Helicobacter sp. 10-6591]
MQTFSNMQRSGSYRQAVKNIFFFAFLFIYQSLVGLATFLPPLLGVFFLLFLFYDDKDDFWHFCVVLGILFVIEAFNAIPLGFLVLLFLLLRYVMILYSHKFSFTRFLWVIEIILVYVGFYCLLVVSSRFLEFGIELSPLILLYYLAVEIIMVGIYEHSL